LQQNDITLDNAPRVNPAALKNVVAASNADLAVVGWLDFSEADTGWIAHWRFENGDTSASWTVSGVNYDAAFRNAVQGVMLSLSGNAKR
jgi:hypothetical protein